VKINSRVSGHRTNKLMGLEVKSMEYTWREEVKSMGYRKGFVTKGNVQPAKKYFLTVTSPNLQKIIRKDTIMLARDAQQWIKEKPLALNRDRLTKILKFKHKSSSDTSSVGSDQSDKSSVMSVTSEQSEAASVKSDPEEVAKEVVDNDPNSCKFLSCSQKFSSADKVKKHMKKHCKSCNRLCTKSSEARKCSGSSKCQMSILDRKRQEDTLLTVRRRMAFVPHDVGTVDTLGLDSPGSSSSCVHDACVAFVLILGLLLSVFLCLRCFRKKPKRDSFGFLPNSRRPSLTQTELMV